MTLLELKDKVREAGVEDDEPTRELAVALLVYNEANPGDKSNDMRVPADIWQFLVESAAEIAAEDA